MGRLVLLSALVSLSEIIELFGIISSDDGIMYSHSRYCE